MPSREGYEPLLSKPPPQEDEFGGGGTAAFRPPSPFGFPPGAHPDDPEALLGGGEAPLAWAAHANLDAFFSSVYRYWAERGFAAIATARLANLAALAFTIAASGVLLLGVDYAALRAPCLAEGTCNVWDVALVRRPLAGPLTLWKALSMAYLAIFAGYWAFAAAHLAQEVRGLAEVRAFLGGQVGLSERALRAATWPEVTARLVAVQRSVRLCIARDLTEADVVSRIMRRENYLIAMLSSGVLALNVPLPGLRRHVLLTKTVEWNLRWCVLDPAIDDARFRLRPEFLADEAALRRRFRVMAVVNAALSPFLLVFLLIYFFMKNAEALYHHPSTIGARRWAPAARWALREFNELPHFLEARLNAGHAAAERYVAQFPNHALSHVARLVAFLAGSFAAVLIALTLADERLLERDLAAGRQTVWWLALLGVVLAAARALIVEPSLTSFDPGLVLLEVAAHTHHLPRHWRGRAHTLEVQEEFQTLFRYRASLFLEELASVVLTPVLLWSSLPGCAGAILRFLEDNKVAVEGVGDVCAPAAFRLHGGCGGGGGVAVPPAGEEEKLEMSLVSFAAAYPTWAPPPEAAGFLGRVAAEGAAAAAGAAGAADAPLFQADAPGDPAGSIMASIVGGGPAPWGAWGAFGSGDPLLGLLASRYPQFLTKARSYALNGAPGGAGVDNALFASAVALPPLPAGGGLAPEEERVVVGQALLQSFYDRQLYGIPEAEEPGGGGGGPGGGGAQPDLPFAFDRASSGGFGAGIYGGASGSLPRAVPSAPAAAASPTAAAAAHRRPSVSPSYASPGAGRPLREMSSELSVLSRETSKAAETPRSPAP